MREKRQALASSKFRVTTVLAGALALGLAGIFATYYQEQAYRQQKIEELTVQGQILAASVTAALVFDDKGAVQEYIEALRVNPELEAAGVYEANGTLFAQIARDSAESVPQSVQQSAPAIENERIVVVLSVVQNNEAVGTVYLRAILDPIERRLLRYGGIGLLVVMALMLISVFAMAQRALTRANARLESQADELAITNQQLQTEIAEREKTEEVLRQTQKMEALGQLSGGIAHDFNNLLAVIRGNLHLLQRRLAQGNTDVVQFVTGANEGVSRAANLTQRILAFARNQPLSADAVNMSQLLGSIGDLLRHSVGPSVRIVVQLESDWLTWCDAQQMENVILNLAINGRDAMPNGGILNIETANHRELGATAGPEPGDYVRIVVKDNGTGMSEEVKRRAFDPFFTTKSTGQGTGLGLSMTFGFVRQCNGLLQLDSEIGKGTAITILLPRYQVSARTNGE